MSDGTLTPEIKKQIDGMTRLQMARKWREAPAGDPLFVGEVGDYFTKRFKELGSFSPEISKQINREKGRRD